MSSLTKVSLFARDRCVENSYERRSSLTPASEHWADHADNHGKALCHERLTSTAAWRLAGPVRSCQTYER